MAIPSLWNPLRSLSRVDLNSDFEDMFRNLGARPWKYERDLAPELRMDVTESDKAYLVSVETPGVRKEDIDVAVDGNRVTITVETKRQREKKKDEEEVLTERYYGKSYRSFTLPSDVDEEHTEAHYENGTLQLMLPKKATSRSRRIDIR
ncbi:Hsp20/alpha crystallin family protein [Oleiagrimonas sp. C23AA]|uniref:Hsp20/alpha crystallin family protein n=1 Tax=Oleiagrimonas sp. C23AA TaxID=2719047 RepID=UPI00142374B5|nr:Hsp20/alpha crystallin family protein [Oleiagrimonas sp. C23AA]NII11095.1 Hsp20/alpha crystallin family protein [Oleiagrimonas sp. C23AA]